MKHVKGIYMNNFIYKSLNLKFKQCLDKCVKLKFNSIIIDLNVTNNLYNHLEKLKYMKSLNLYIIVRIVVFENVQLESFSKYSYDFDPLDKIYLDKIIKFINLIVTYNIIDEIQLDYIRYPINYQLSILEKTKNIEKVIDYINLKRKNIKMSIDLFGITIVSKNSITVGQNINFADKADYVSPMIYPCHWGKKWGNINNPKDNPYRLINSVVNIFIKLYKEKYINKFRPYIRGWNYSKKKILDQILALNDNKINSFLVWTTNIDSTLNTLLEITN